jgi:hypothetical protein
MMEDIVLIGKVTQSTPNMVELEYPSMAGVNSIRLPRTMIARFERISNDRVAVLVRTDESERGQATYNSLIGDNSPLHVTEEHLEIVSAYEYGEPLSVVNTSSEDEAPLWMIQQPLVTVVNDDGSEQFALADEPFDGMLFSGGRKKVESMNWDFEPTRKPAFVMHEEGAAGSTVARVNDNDGKPVAYHIFNPTYANDKRPAGAYLGTFSASYYPMPYRKGFGPALDMAAQRGWPAQVIAWDEGKRAAMFVDVTSNIDWNSAGSKLGEQWTRRGFQNAGDYRIGFVIYNSLDGSSSFKVQAMAQKLLCSNGMMLGDAATVVSLKHTVNTLGNYNFEKLASQIMDVIETAAQEIIVAETMRDIEVNRDTFEKLMTICEKKGLITKPTIKRDDAGNVSAITRGHMWRVMGQGWINNNESWVAVEDEHKGSLYHVYNILTGAITHKPTWTDGETTLKGSTLNFSTLTERLSKVHSVFGDMTRKAVNGTPILQQLEKVPLFSAILH